MSSPPSEIQRPAARRLEKLHGRGSAADLMFLKERALDRARRRKTAHPKAGPAQHATIKNFESLTPRDDQQNANGRLLRSDHMSDQATYTGLRANPNSNTALLTFIARPGRVEGNTARSRRSPHCARVPESAGVMRPPCRPSGPAAHRSSGNRPLFVHAQE